MNDELERNCKVEVVSPVRYCRRLFAAAEKHKKKTGYFYPVSSKHAAIKITKHEVELTVVYLLTNQVNETLKR